MKVNQQDGTAYDRFIETVTKASEKLKGILNDVVAREIHVSIQYMWQHVQVIEVKGIAVRDQFKQTVITERRRTNIGQIHDI